VARLNYLELPAQDIAASRRFYGEAFGMAWTDYGPNYSCTTTGDVDFGLDGDLAEATRAPLPVIRVEDLDATLAAVKKAGGEITKEIFSFPGGKRFHFRDPHGNELAAWVEV
jgi:predicted enzyme related to lactoylglutathione lyase